MVRLLVRRVIAAHRCCGPPRGRSTRALRAALGGDAADLAHLVPDIREQIAELPALDAGESPQARFRLFDA